MTHSPESLHPRMGTQSSRTAKMRISHRATTKLGMTTPSMARKVTALSTSEFWW